MRRKAITLAIIMMAAVAVPFVASAEPEIRAHSQPVPAKAESLSFWQKRGCDHGHRSKIGYRRIKTLLRNHQPTSVRAAKSARHYAVCVETRKKSRALKDYLRRSYLWRKLYAHVWIIRFNGLPDYGRSWSWNTGACESGNNPSTVTGNGFRGAFQWVMSTWYAAGGRGDPAAASWHHQAVLAWHWHVGHPTGQWPVCGE